METMQTGNKIVDLTFAFALKIISFTEILQENKKFIIANQLLRSGTSVRANTREAQNCEAKQILFISLRLLPKRLKKQNIGCYYANILKAIHLNQNHLKT